MHSTNYGKKLRRGKTEGGAVLGRWAWPRIRRTVNGINYYSTGWPCTTAILLIKGGKKPKPKIGLKKCPGVWHDLKSQLGYYDIRKHANPEQVCLAKCREDSNCKAAQVQFGKLPKVKVKSAGVGLVRGKSVFYKNYEYRTLGNSCPTAGATRGCGDNGCGGTARNGARGLGFPPITTARWQRGGTNDGKGGDFKIVSPWSWAPDNADARKVVGSYPWGTDRIFLGGYRQEMPIWTAGMAGASKARKAMGGTPAGWPRTGQRPMTYKGASGKIAPRFCISRVLIRKKTGGKKKGDRGAPSSSYHRRGKYKFAKGSYAEEWEESAHSSNRGIVDCGKDAKGHGWFDSNGPGVDANQVCRDNGYDKVVEWGGTKGYQCSRSYDFPNRRAIPKDGKKICCSVMWRCAGDAPAKKREEKKGGGEGPMRCWTYSSDKAKKSTNNSKTAAYFKDKGRSCSVPKPPPPKKVKKIVAVKKPLKKVPLKKRVLKLRKNTNCPDGLKIKSHSECWQALKKLGLFSRTHWTGKDPKVPIGCSWTNSVSAVGKSMGLWNYSLSGKARYDLHPICYRPPLAPQKTTGILKAINKRLLEKSIEKEEDPVPIALTVGVSKDSQKKVTSSQSLFKEAMSVLGDQYKINHFRDQGSGQRSKTNSDLSNHAPFVREGFDVKMTGKVPDDFKALATNAFLIDMAHLKGEDLTGVPVNLNLSLNDGGEKTIEQV